MRTVDDLLSITSKLDARYHLLRGEMESSTGETLIEVARILADAGVPYALIGGVAVQFHSTEPRTTLDIEIAAPDDQAIPRDRFEKKGFKKQGRFAHSENWTGPDGTPVQFTLDPAYATTIASAEIHRIGKTQIRIGTALDVVRMKLLAFGDEKRRKSKRAQDLVDAMRLVEEHPEILRALTASQRATLERL